MHFTLASAALVASAGLSLAAPAELVGRSTFQVAQVPKGMVRKNGPIQMHKTYDKYAHVGAVAPAAVKAAAAAQQGSVAANPEQFDQSYLCPVTVGAKTLNLDFDTGSADL